MQFPIDSASYSRYAKGRLSRAALWLAVLVISLQLVAMGFHKHDLSEQSDNCVACYLSAHVPAGFPKVPDVVMVRLAAIAYRIALQPVYSFLAVQTRYLLPFPQAPPRLSSPV